MSAIKHLDQRVAVFIDAQNLYHTAKHVYNNSKVHFGRVVEAAVAGRNLVRAIAYVISTESRDESSFFEALGKNGIEIKTKDLQIFIDGSKKADWDVAMSIDAIRISEKVDCVIIVSGDGDFVPLLQYLKQSGVQTEVVSFGKSISSELKKEADIFMDLSEDLDLFLIGNSYHRNNFTNTNHGSFTNQSNTTSQNKNTIHQNIKSNFQKKPVKNIKVVHVDNKVLNTKNSIDFAADEVEKFLKEEKKVEVKKPATKEEFFKQTFNANKRDNFKKKN
jgi:uncharacterized LabA/DUF88 family protein